MLQILTGIKWIVASTFQIHVISAWKPASLTKLLDLDKLHECTSAFDKLTFFLAVLKCSKEAGDGLLWFGLRTCFFLQPTFHTNLRQQQLPYTKVQTLFCTHNKLLSFYFLLYPSTNQQTVDHLNEKIEKTFLAWHFHIIVLLYKLTSLTHILKILM